MTIQIVGKPGFRYASDFKRPDSGLVLGYRDLIEKTGCLTGNVGDCLGRLAAMDHRIAPLAKGMKIVGPALTVRVAPSDNLMIHKAFTLARPGDVIVVDGAGAYTSALLGSLMANTAAALNLGGLVVDGLVRDAAEIIELGLPVFAAGLSPNGPFKEGPGEINFPISCGGRQVNPGDLIVADDDGVVVVPQDQAAEVLAKIPAVIEREANRVAEIKAGQVDRPGLDEIMAAKGLKA